MVVAATSTAVAMSFAGLVTTEKALRGKTVRVPVAEANNDMRICFLAFFRRFCGLLGAASAYAQRAPRIGLLSADLCQSRHKVPWL